MKKIIKRYGGSHIITLNAEDLKIYEIKEGDIVEIHIRKENLKGKEVK